MLLSIRDQSFINNTLISQSFEKNFNITKDSLKNIKVKFEIESLKTEVPFFGQYIERVIKEQDPINEINENERIVNIDNSFTWKTLRLLSERDLNSLNTDNKSKVLNISEVYYNKYKINDEKVINFKHLPPNIKLEPKDKEELPKISMPKKKLEIKENSNDNNNSNNDEKC